MKLLKDFLFKSPGQFFTDNRLELCRAASGCAGTGSPGVSSFEGRTGAITLTSADITAALGFTPGDATASDPTTQVGLTTINGSATTYMRSDAAPALDQSIIPIWTGIHTFAANPIIKNDIIPSLLYQLSNGTQLGFVNFGDGTANVPSFIGVQTSNQLRVTVGNSADATFTFASAGQFGIGNPVQFGTAGQVLTSGGPTGVLSWTTPSTSTGANPTVQVGLTATNGAATTFMRSDASPALSQSIAPTWSGIHTFTNRIIQTQTTPATVSTSTGTANVSPLTVTGGAGGSTSASTGTPTAGNAGDINITSGNGGGLTGTPTAGFAGRAGKINITGGNGGAALSAGTTAGAGGDIEIAGGTGGNASSSVNAGRPGYVSIKGGNTAGSANNDGGHIYVVPGIPTGTGLTGGIFLGLSPSDVVRGTTFIGCPVEDLPNGVGSSLYVKGKAIFINDIVGNATINATQNTTAAGPTNSGVAITSNTNLGDVLLFDSTQTANNRTAELIFFQGALQHRFKSDSGATAIVGLSIAGGQGSGITGITSNSGSGTWTHTGSYVATGTISSLPAGGNSVILTGSANGGVPTISTDGSNANVSLQINTKGAGGITLNSTTNITGTATIAGLSSTTQASLALISNSPGLEFYVSNYSANRRRWELTAGGAFFTCSLVSDDGATRTNAYSTFNGANLIGGHLWYLGAAPGTQAMTLNSTGFCVGPTNGDASAIMEAQSTTQGFLPPRMTTTQRDAIASPAAGLIVYNNTTNKLNFYNGTAWEVVTSA